MLFSHSSKSSILSDMNDGPTLPGDVAGFWRRIHRYPEFVKASEEEQKEFLQFILELVKHDLALHQAGEFLKHDVILDSRIFPMAAVCDPIKTEDVDFAGNTVVARVHEPRKLIPAILDIKHHGFQKSENYFDGDYYPDLRLIIIRNGIHHSAVEAILDNGKHGQASCEVYHIADAYPLIDVADNFRSWKLPDGKEIPVIEPRYALSYMLAKELKIGV